MPAAVPHYLQPHLAEAAPGHRFGLYYAGWNDDFSKPKSGVTAALKNTVCPLPEHSRKLLKNLVDRQQDLANGLPHHFSWPAIATSPFATGLGNEHPLENGFAFLSPYGLPYLPGSGIKGVLRRAAEELASGEWGDRHGWTAEYIANLFGPGENDPTRDSAPRQGALRFWDVYPQPAASIKDDRLLLGVEIMTPHLGDYYQGKATPNTSLSPNPIPFLSVLPGSRFCFHVECHPGLVAPELSEASDNPRWQSLLAAAFEHAGEWLGFGAKTAVGYGRMVIDRDEQERQSEAAQKALKARQLARLTLAQQKIDEFITDCQKRQAELMGGKDKPNTTYHAKANALAKQALESTAWTADEKSAVADAIETWLPQIVAVDIKEVKKKLKLNALRGIS